MQDDTTRSAAEVLLFSVPSIIGVIFSLCRLDERISKPSSKIREAKRFCEIGADDQPEIFDPGGSGWYRDRRPAHAIRRKGFAASEDEEN